MYSVRNHFAAVWRRWGAEQPVARAMTLNWSFGMGIGLFCAVLLLVFDFFGLRSLLWRSDLAFVGSAMLCAAFAFTFGGVVGAAAIMQIDDDGDRPRGRRLRLPRPRPRQPVGAPLPVRARRRD